MIRRWLGIGIALVSVAVIVYGQTQNQQSDGWLVDAMGLLAIASPSVVGAYLVWRLPENLVGLILAGFGLTFALGVMGEGVSAAGGPLAGWSAWLGIWLWAASLVLLLVFLPLFFPDGRLPSARYRWVAPATLTGLGLFIFGNAFVESVTVGTASDPTTIVLPISFPRLSPFFEPAAVVGMALVLVAVGAALFGAVQRYRRSVGIERQQIRVFAAALAVAVTAIVLNMVLYELGYTEDANLVFALVVLVLVSSIAVAVLRYRLYDFDKVIRRTLIYGVVTVLLAGVYVGCVLGLQALLGSNDPLAVAASTLAAAALFQPVRRRVQSFVDRRFDRQRYDAGRVVDNFGTRLRDEVDLDGLATDLTAVVGSTLRPASVTLWLREEAR